MERDDSSARGHLAEPLITINPKDIDAQTRIPSVIAMATHATVAAWTSNEDNFKTVEGVNFEIRTVSGSMGLWEFEYKKKAESLDGKARDEYVRLGSLEAIGPSEDSQLAQSVLNEGAKNLSGKDKGGKK